jgi:hypothetical protein
MSTTGASRTLSVIRYTNWLSLLDQPSRDKQACATWLT